jgi:hypothetical protein
MLNNTSIISVSPDVMGGTPVFIGTRVPVQTLLDYLKAGETIDDFLDGFPTVNRKSDRFSSKSSFTTMPQIASSHDQQQKQGRP